MSATEPYLPFDLEVIDAEALHRALDMYEELYVTYSNGRYWLKTRQFIYEVDWTTHFEVSKMQAQRIVAKGFADWWITVDKSAR